LQSPTHFFFVEFISENLDVASLPNWSQWLLCAWGRWRTPELRHAKKQVACDWITARQTIGCPL